MEITEALIDTIGKEKTEVRLFPLITFKDMDYAEILDAIMIVAK